MCHFVVVKVALRLGYFRYTLDTVGVENLEDFDFEKQVKAVRVEFIPERTRLANGNFGRSAHGDPLFAYNQAVEQYIIK